MVDQSRLTLRPFQASDVDDLIVLFRTTVHQVNAADYEPEQLHAWAPDTIERTQWLARMEKNRTTVAIVEGTYAGFAELTNAGIVHMLFVSAGHQRCGIATAIYGAIEEQALSAGYKCLQTYASLTARGFFSRVGFIKVRTNVAEINGQKLDNFFMEKKLS